MFFDRFRHLILILALLFLNSMYACGMNPSQEPDQMPSEKTAVTMQPEERFDTLLAFETRLRENENIELEPLDIPDHICYAVYFPNMQAIRFITLLPDNDQYIISNCSEKLSVTVDDKDGEVPISGQYLDDPNYVDFCFSKQPVTSPDILSYAEIRFSSAYLYYKSATT